MQEMERLMLFTKRLDGMRPLMLQLFGVELKLVVKQQEP